MSVLYSQNGVIIKPIDYTNALGAVDVGGKKYPYNQYGGILFTTLNLDYLPTGVALGASGAPTTPSAWYYNNDETTYGWNGLKYGLLYNKYALSIINSLLPDGWIVMTYASIWNNLRSLYNNNYSGSANKWKKENISGWNGTNKLFFNVVPSGYRNESGNFAGIGNTCIFWAEETPDSELKFDTTNSAGFWGSDKKRALSVRLCKYI